MHQVAKPQPLERFELLKLEMELLQGTLDKYDQLIFQNRSWFITVWVGIVGVAFTVRSRDVAALAAVAAVVYWILEGLLRHQYWYKYVLRYRAIREWLNDPASPDSISVYDLTNHYGTPGEPRQRFRKSFLKLEPTVVYVLMGLGALIARALVPIS